MTGGVCCREGPADDITHRIKDRYVIGQELSRKPSGGALPVNFFTKSEGVVGHF